MTDVWGAHQLADWVLSMGHEEIDWLKAEAMLLTRDPIIINIGAAAGVSTLAMLEARPDALIYSCEMDPGAGEYSSLERAGLDKSRVIRLGKSQAEGLRFDQDVDFIFVDGGHSVCDVTGDIAAWLPHLKPGCVIAFHDYSNPGFGGVRRGVDQAIGDLAIIADVGTIRAFRK